MMMVVKYQRICNKDLFRVSQDGGREDKGDLVYSPKRAVAVALDKLQASQKNEEKMIVFRDCDRQFFNQAEEALR